MNTMTSNEWQETTLDQLGRIVTGKTPSSRNHEYFGGGIPFVTPSDFDETRLIDSTERHLTRLGADAVKGAQIPSEAVMVTCIGSQMGQSAMTTAPSVTNQQINSIIVHPGNDALFIYYNLSNRREEIRSLASGSAVPILNKSAFGQLKISLPTLPVQQSIAHVLGTLDDKIKLNRRMNRTLEEMARVIFQDWFVDFGPTRAKMGGQEPYLPPELWDLFPDELVDSELGEIPEGWEVGVLHDAIEILSGGTPKTSIPEYWNGNIPWYTAKDAPDPSDVFVVNTERSITPAGVANSSTQVLPTGTTIITARGTVGRLACLGIPMAMNQTCYGIRGADGYPEYFTYWNVRNTVSDLQSRTHGTIFDTITRDTFKIADAVLAPAELACAFDETVNPLMSRILGNLTESSQLKLQRKSLLPRLISGEVSAASLG